MEETDAFCPGWLRRNRLPWTPRPPFEAWQSGAGWRRRAGGGSPAPSGSTRRTESARAGGWCRSRAQPSGLRSRRDEHDSQLSILTPPHSHSHCPPTCCSPKSVLVNCSGRTSSTSTAPFIELASNNCRDQNANRSLQKQTPLCHVSHSVQGVSVRTYMHICTTFPVVGSIKSLLFQNWFQKREKRVLITCSITCLDILECSKL